ncbi:nicotinate phosphoribosyltransferase [Christiangramia sp. OXR-203]|jgi:nicotinate phosphoribosyltransferase|uniref:nicotinate phosphoribosyltransferase n=1 Tax=Christiangramia sp. OXR-203 TaxID=3100176 RepID=UPI002AC96DCA|nr:nicotinate phosphoribosyltransferase [Christiangramia sp. OXR-203]WPY98855.1 nicotinate phosphoribosyltransferase [Christiangramia sp. OXR-203]
MNKFTATYTDQYQLSMAQVYFKKGQKEQQAVFDYYFRKLPFKSGYAIFSGLEDLLEILKKLRFSEDDLEFLKEQGFEKDFLEYLKDFQFKGKIYSVKEGDIVFPTRPILQVEASIIEAQIIETILLNLLNFQTLIATKASRMRLVAGDATLLDFGLRRAQASGGYFATRAAIIGGFNGTSNVVAGKDFDIPVSGTMAHSFVQSYDDELTAFRDFAEGRPENCVFLVDTYNTLKSGIPNAIKVAMEMEERGQKLLAVRLDSGDLSYFAKESRKMLDAAGLDYVKIAASNQLDEHVIKSLLEQQAPIDIFGVGTNLVTGDPDGALDGVYKLAFSAGKPRIKISESIIKITLPHKKQVFRIKDENGKCIGADAIGLYHEDNIQEMHHPFEPYKSMNLKYYKLEALLELVMDKGKVLQKKRSLSEISEYSIARLSELPIEYKRFNNPHIYKIGISELLKEERDQLIKMQKNKI